MSERKPRKQQNTRPPRGVRVKIDHPWKLFGRVMGFIGRQYIVLYVFVILMIAVSVVANQYGVLFNRTLIDDYIRPLEGVTNADFGPLGKAILTLAAIYAVGTAAAFIRERLMLRISQGSLKKLRDEMFTKMERLPIRYFDTHSHGEIMSLYTNDVDTLRQLISQSIPSFFMSGLTLVMTFTNMIRLSPILTLVSLSMVVIMMISTKYLTGKSSHYYIKRQKSLGEVNGYIEEMINGQKVIKTFCHEKTSIKEFSELNESLRDSEYKANKFSMLMMPINAQLGNVSYVLVAIIGGILAIRGSYGFTLGALASFLLLNRNFARPINEVSMQFNSVLLGLAGAERIFKLMDETPELDEGYVTLVNAEKNENGEIVEAGKRTGMWAWKHYHKATDTTTYVELKGDVVFKDVTFGYNPDKMVLHDIDLYATPGQKIAFVGSTGAGKTTITNLINRFYDIPDGKIRYDGINITKIKKDDLRHSLGMVLQETHLFTATVREKIRYGNLNAADEEVEAAAKLANAHDFIKRLPNGYDTMLEGDGSNLSQGQRQLIAIARAAIADPPVLILDEATSSIDTHTEELVQKGMDELMKGRTTFVIAHRLSTVKNADCIMVLEHGRIIERGNHDALIERKGRYYQLYTGLPAENLPETPSAQTA